MFETNNTTYTYINFFLINTYSFIIKINSLHVLKKLQYDLLHLLHNAHPLHYTSKETINSVSFPKPINIP